MIPGWLEPLLDRVAENRTTVVTPVIDCIVADTFEYANKQTKSVQIGGFGWDLVFSWHDIPERELKRRKSTVDPVQ
jgi:polypeptide N-acetylgalactosaminyltransferase